MCSVSFSENYATVLNGWCLSNLKALLKKTVPKFYGEDTKLINYCLLQIDWIGSDSEKEILVLVKNMKKIKKRDQHDKWVLRQMTVYEQERRQSNICLVRFMK